MKVQQNWKTNKQKQQH